MENDSPIHIDQKVDYHNHVDTAEILHYLKRIFKEVDMAEERLTAVLANQENFKESLITITNKLNQMAKTLDEVLQSVTENATVGDSVITLLNGIKAQLDAALSGVNLPPAVQAKVDAIFEASEADKQKLQDAITANTPAEGGGEQPPA